MVEFVKVRGTQETKPEEIDTTSSQYYTYIRKNIKKVDEPGDDYNPPFKGWEYEECKVLNDEWVTDQLKENKEMNETIMLGLCDIYTQQIGE